jgi:hypothetical protein
MMYRVIAGFLRAASLVRNEPERQALRQFAEEIRRLDRPPSITSR